jgi:hypothetical protein
MFYLRRILHEGKTIFVIIAVKENNVHYKILLVDDNTVVILIVKCIFCIVYMKSKNTKIFQLFCIKFIMNKVEI